MGLDRPLGQRYLTFWFLVLAPHLTMFSGGAIMLAVRGCNLLGDGLRDLLDPRGHTH